MRTSSIEGHDRPPVSRAGPAGLHHASTTGSDDSGVTMHVLPLSKICLADAGRFGRKAAVLGELTAAGFTVPAGFAVAASAALAGSELVTEVREALAVLGARSGARRSSGIDEALSGRSYAGQYETVLNVLGLDAVLDAIRT